jgi:hypothetical protein
MRRRGATAARILGVLAVVGCCLGAAAFAATRPDPAPRQQGQDQSASQPLRPRIVEHPEPVTTIALATFTVSQPGRPPRRASPGHPLSFQCRLDGGGWEHSRPPLSLDDPGYGRHRFEVRAVNDGGRSGPAAAFEWRLRREPRVAAPEPTPTPTPTAPPISPPPAPPVEPPQGDAEPFSIEQTAALPDLYPGAAAQPIPLRLENPNPIPIAVTALSVAIAAEPPGCPSDENFALAPADVSAAAPLTIAAESALALPAEGIDPPTIAMRELPVSQDACQGAELELRFEGDAVG